MKNARKTLAKTKILNFIKNSESAVAHSEIQHSMNGICDRVTTYRVLERLVREGSIHKIVNTDGVLNYAACNTCKEKKHFHHHVHFSCESCNTITCLDNVLPTYQLPSNYTVTETNFMLSGLCPQCS